MEQIYYFSLDQTNFYHSNCRISHNLLWVEIKKTPLLNTSSDIQSLCITKNPFFLFSNLKIGLPCGVYMLYETKFY